jgi:hypothetical protein
MGHVTHNKVNILKALLFVFMFYVLCSMSHNLCFAQADVLIAPTIIDEEAQARDVLEFSVNIKNQGNKNARLYAIVNDLSMKEGKQEFLDPSQMSNSTSLARWIRIERSRIELKPGQEIDIPLSIEVSPLAEFGKYYAIISFAQGSNQEDAANNALKINQPQLLINLEIKERIVEKAQIKQFQTEKRLFSEFPVKFFLEIENIGNNQINPEGSIYIYNRKGEEVGLIPINKALAGIAPLGSEIFNNDWDSTQAFGQYKARLVAKYGTEEGKDLQDTIYFWVLPRGFLILALIIILILVFTSLFILFKKRKTSFKKPSNISTIDISS